MKVTNRLGLPDAIVRAVSNDTYNSGDCDYSVTTLLTPPRIVALRRKHGSEIVEDAAERIWSMLGQAVHVIAERANHHDVAERRLSIEINGKKISGGMDLYSDDGLITDYKVTTVWKVKEGYPEEWEMQLNAYCQILRANGYKVSGCQVIAILRDWSKLARLRDSSYPEFQVKKITVPLWSEQKAFDFLTQRVEEHEAAKVVLPECTAEERWEKPTVYAVMLPGRKTALKLYEVEENALEHAARLLGAKVVLRPGESVRCANYCNASNHCSQYKTIKEKS